MQPLDTEFDLTLDLIQTLEHVESIIKDTPAIIAGREPKTVLEGRDRDVVLELISNVLKRATNEALALPIGSVPPRGDRKLN